MPEFVLILIRSLLAFAMLLMLARLMGKKQISQLTYFDYIVGITIGNISAAMAVDQGVKIVDAALGLVVWGVLPIIIGVFGLKSNTLRRIFDGKPTDLIRDGKVLKRNLRKERMNTGDLMLGLRNKNAFNLTDVEFAVLETNGQLSVMKKAEAQPLTPKAFGLQVATEAAPRLVVIDGNVMEKTLTTLGYSREWLLEQLNRQGMTRIEDTFLAQVDSEGKLYAVGYKDTGEKLQTKHRLMTLAASLNQAQTDLEQFTLHIEDHHLRQSYVRLSQRMKQTADQLLPYMNQ